MNNNEKIGSTKYELFLSVMCILMTIIIFIRAFLDVNFTDEAYYVAEALTMFHGNLPYAFDDYTFGTGFPFLLIPQVALFELITKNNEGIFLFTRISFLIFRFGIYYLSYRILIKKYKKASVLGLFLILISFSEGVGVFNYSYNSIPALLSLISGILLHDVIENGVGGRRIKLVLVGFLMGISFLAHPAYAVAILVFGVIIIFRTKDRKEILHNLACCVLGGLAEMLVVFIPIFHQVGIELTICGISQMFSRNTGNSSSAGNTIAEKLDIILVMYGHLLVIVGAFALLYLVVRYLIYKKADAQKIKELPIIFSSACLLALSVFCAYKTILNDSIQYRFGMIGLIAVAFIVFIKGCKRFTLVYYLGIYPILIALLMILKVNSANPKYRFNTAVLSLAVCFMFMMESETERAKLITVISILVCTTALQICNFKPVFGKNISQKVEEGVYKGVLTSEELAVDLPNLEKYLNGVIGEDDLYSFRDMAPYCYLMMHKGRMCDLTTWDSLNYFGKHSNSPKRLYMYYERKNEQPDKIIFVKYSQFENLSIYQKDIDYNKYIESYYILEREDSVGTEFEDIIVFSVKDKK